MAGCNALQAVITWGRSPPLEADKGLPLSRDSSMARSSRFSCMRGATCCRSMLAAPKAVSGPQLHHSVLSLGDRSPDQSVKNLYLYLCILQTLKHLSGWSVRDEAAAQLHEVGQLVQDLPALAPMHARPWALVKGLHRPDTSLPCTPLGCKTS